MDIKYLLSLLIMMGFIILRNCQIEQDIVSEGGLEIPKEIIMEDNLSDIYSVVSKELKIGNIRKRVSRYIDDNDNIVCYQVNEGDLTTDYFLEDGIVLIRARQKGEKTIQEDWLIQNGNDILSINSKTEKTSLVMTMQQVDFLYEKLLDEQEKNNFSKIVALGDQVTFNDFDDYKKYLTFGNEKFIKNCYTYESDGSNLTLEQALDLCATVVIAQAPDLEMERVMKGENEGFVGYKLNSREFGDTDNKQIIENRIGTLNAFVFDGMAYHLYMYEYIIDEMSGESHTAITGDYHIFLRDKILILEGI